MIWVGQLSEILNRNDPTNTVEEDEIVELEEIEEIDIGRWPLQEVKDALKSTKPGKAARVDEVCPELLRADMEETACRLTSCYNRLWETETWPKVWKKALRILRIPVFIEIGAEVQCFEGRLKKKK